MNILFIILKIIGILLLVVLFLILLMLFHPLFYKVKAEVEGEISIKGYVWWLFQILRLEFEIEEDKKEIYLRVFGFRKELLSESEEKDVSEDTGTGKTAATVQEEKLVGQAETEYRQPVSSRNNSEQQSGEDKTTEEASTKNADKTTDKSGLKSKRMEFGNFSKIIRKEISDERNHLAVSHLWKEFVYLLGHLKPKYAKGNISFSTGDPATTGEVTGVLSLFPVVYRYDVHILPDFLSEEMYVRGNLTIKGHIALWHISCSLIRLLRDKNIKRLMYKFRK